LLFPAPFLFLGLPTLVLPLPSRLFFPSPLLLDPSSLLFCLQLRLPHPLLLFPQSLFFDLPFAPLPLLIGTVGDVPAGARHLPPCTQRDAQIALARAAHIAVLCDVPCRSGRALVLLPAPATDGNSGRRGPVGGALGWALCGAPSARIRISGLARRQN